MAKYIFFQLDIWTPWHLSNGHFVNWHFVYLSFCHLDLLWHFGYIYLVGILSTQHFVYSAFCQLNILVTWYFSQLTFCKLGILVTWYLIGLKFCQLDILSNCHFGDLIFWLVNIFLTYLRSITFFLSLSSCSASCSLASLSWSIFSFGSSQQNV